VISQVMEVSDLSQVILDRLHLAGDASPLHRFATAVAAAKVALAMAEMASAVAKELDASTEAVAVEASHWERTKEELATAKKAHLAVMEIKEKIDAKKVKINAKKARKQKMKRQRQRQGHPSSSQDWSPCPLLWQYGRRTAKCAKLSRTLLVGKARPPDRPPGIDTDACYGFKGLAKSGNGHA